MSNEDPIIPGITPAERGMGMMETTPDQWAEETKERRMSEDQKSQPKETGIKPESKEGEKIDTKPSKPDSSDKGFPAGYETKEG